MSQTVDASYLGDFPLAAEAPAVERLGFIRKTYAHLVGAVAAFVGLEALLFTSGFAENFTMSMGRQWFVVLLAFMAVSWLAQRWAESNASPAMQYLGLGLYVLAEAIIFTPLLYVSARFGGPNVIPTAAFMTLLIFLGLTAIVFVSKKDFSFLGPVLWIAGLAAMGCIFGGMIFGFTPGNLFTVAMIAFAGGWILYDTSNVLHRYRVGQHVAASLALFASVALLFWYVLRFVNSRR